MKGFGALVAEHPGRVGPNVTWNIEQGRRLTIADLRRATELQAAVAERVTEFFGELRRAGVPGQPGGPVRRGAGLGP